MSSAFIRTVSPGLNAIASTVASVSEVSNTFEVKANARHATIMSATAVHEVIEFVPSDYRGCLAESLNALAALVTKLFNARQTLKTWERHQQQGTMPPLLKGTAPKVQFSSEFSGRDQARQAQTDLDTRFTEFQVASLTRAIRAKRDEVAALTTETSAEHLFPTLQRKITDHSVSVLARRQLPTMEVNMDGGEAVSGWGPLPAAITVRDEVLHDCSVYAMQVVSIVTYALTNKATKIEKKKNLATAARTSAGDIDMGNTPQSAESIRKLVQDAVQKALRNPANSPKPSRKGGASNKAGKKDTKELMAKAKVSSAQSSFSAVAAYFLGQLRQSNRQTAGTPTSVRPPAIQEASMAELFGIRDQE